MFGQEHSSFYEKVKNFIEGDLNEDNDERMKVLIENYAD